MTSDEDGRTDTSMGRRTVLKGAATAGALGAGVTGTAGASDTDWWELTLCSASEKTFEYYVKVDGKVKRGGTYESDDWDEVGRDYVKGAVSEGRCDSFLVKGKVVGFESSGYGKVKAGGKVLRTGGDEDHHDGDGKDGKDRRDEKDDEADDKPVKDEDEPRLGKLLVVSSPDTDELLNYTFRVTGDLEELEPDEDTGRAVDEVIDLGDRGVRVEGAVSTGDDRFAFSGELIEEDVPAGVELTVYQR